MRLIHDAKANRLDKRVTFRMTDDERDRLAKLSDKLKMNNSDILRCLIDDEYNKLFKTKTREWSRK